MTTGEIVASAIAVLSLMVSLLTAYLTLLSKFNALVLPKRRVFLTQIDSVPCMVLECECINDGAKPGSIEDILVKMRHLETGAQTIFSPILVRDQFSVFQVYQASDFSAFSGISFGARQRRELFVVFKPMIQTVFEPPNGTVTLQVSTRSSATSKWTDSPTRISLNLDGEVPKLWASPNGAPLQIQALEIGRKRREYIENQK